MKFFFHKLTKNEFLTGRPPQIVLGVPFERVYSVDRRLNNEELAASVLVDVKITDSLHLNVKFVGKEFINLNMAATILFLQLFESYFKFLKDLFHQFGELTLVEELLTGGECLLL